jgi:hypothetical protein
MFILIVEYKDKTYFKNISPLKQLLEQIAKHQY